MSCADIEGELCLVRGGGERFGALEGLKALAAVAVVDAGILRSGIGRAEGRKEEMDGVRYCY